MLKTRDILAQLDRLDELRDGGGEDRGHNLLVISDLHLGDSLRPSSPGYLRELARLNRALGRFLKHYARHAVGGRPWRLVIAGDMIDFLHAGLFEPEKDHREREHAPIGEAEAIAWLEQVMVRERLVFRLLASFVGAGHELVIIKGNHDVEFAFEGVQRRFTELLLALHASRLEVRRRRARDSAQASAQGDGARADDGAAEDAEQAAFLGRISFCRWFYYERDLVYIEHGNQYDAFCSFEHVLSPIDPEHFELEDPISHRTYREFAGLVGSLDVHAIDQWKLADYARWLFGLGPALIGRLAYTYFASVSWIVRTKKRLVLAARRKREAHLRFLSHLARRFGLKEEVLRALDELRERPAGASVFLGLNMLYMDRVLLAAIDLVAIGLAASVSGPTELRAGVAGGVVALSLVAHFLLESYREVDPHPKLMKMAHKIARLLKVPFVVFGHTHRALATSTKKALEAAGAAPVDAGDQAGDPAGDPEAWYFNTGSWTHAGSVGLTHVCILRGDARGGYTAELRRWCTEKNRPLTIEAPAPVR